MTIPNFLDDTVQEPGDYTEVITDVATIITTVRNLITGTAAGWTEPSTGLFKSPVIDNRWMDILLTRINATTLEIRTRNHLGTTVRTGRIQIGASTTVDYYWGNFYLLIVSRQATAELSWSVILDVEPDEVTSVANYVIAFAYRDTGNNPISNTVSVWIALDNGSSSQAGRLVRVYEDTDGNQFTGSATGRLLYFPAHIRINQSGINAITGRIPCVLICPGSLSFDTVKSPGVDTSTSRKFIVLPWPTSNSMRLMVRKPSLD